MLAKISLVFLHLREPVCLQPSGILQEVMMLNITVIYGAKFSAMTCSIQGIVLFYQLE